MQAIDHASVNTLRFWRADQVEKAKSVIPVSLWERRR